MRVYRLYMCTHVYTYAYIHSIHIHICMYRGVYICIHICIDINGFFKVLGLVRDPPKTS